MNKTIINSDEYKDIATKLFALIQTEIEDCESKDSEALEPLYPKLIVMYEFFRLLRGEAFLAHREPAPGFSADMYKMEDDIANRLKIIKTKIDPNSKRLKFYYDQLVSMFLKI